MDFELSVSTGVIISHAVDNIFKKKHPSQSKQCVLIGLEYEWRIVSKEMIILSNCCSLLN